jgi:hypothetical protein
VVGSTPRQIINNKSFQIKKYFTLTLSCFSYIFVPKRLRKKSLKEFIPKTTDYGSAG